MEPAFRCHIFCSVVDNFGDAGVCWRLARQLSVEFGWRVHLFIDRPEVLQVLIPDALPGSESGKHAGEQVDVAVPATFSAPPPSDVVDADRFYDGVVITAWPAAWHADVIPADVVIEAFACALPPAYETRMARQPSPPVWINLEYLSAETWVSECHLSRSVHPRLALQKTFFFPGLRSGTGGVLREEDLLTRRRAFAHDLTLRAATWRALGLPGVPEANTLVVSLFCYDNPRLSRLLSAWADGGTPVRVLALAGPATQQVGNWLAIDDFSPGTEVRRGALTVVAVPFVAQSRYDALLWLADINFVRGEDSFVRAQWAGLPFVWHIYPQEDGAHRVKLDAFLDLYCAAMPTQAAAEVRGFFQWWNGTAPAAARNVAGVTRTPMPRPLDPRHQAPADAWARLLPHLSAWRDAAAAWPAQLQLPGTLAANLADFVKSQLK